MTEQTVPFGGTAVAEHPAPMLPTGFDDDGDNGSRRKLAVVGAIVGVLVLLIVAFFMLKGGGSAAPAGGTVPPGHAAAGAAGKSAHAAKPVTLPRSFKGNVGRDPFNPLYTPPVAKPANPGTSTGTGSSTGTGTGTTTGSTGSTGTGSTGAGRPAAFVPVWVELVSVKGSKSASFVVGESNGKKSRTVQYAGILVPTNSLRTTFGSVFALLSVQDGTATVQFGDGTPFDLAPGFGNRHFVG